MVRKSTTAHWPRFFLALCFIFPALVAYGQGPEDLLDLRKLTKKLKLSPAQQDSARRKISQIQNTLKAFEWDYASGQAFGQGVESSSEGSPEVHPVNLDSLVEVAAMLLELGDPKGAASAHRTLGAIYLSGRQLDAAEEAFDRARRLDDSAASWFGLGLVAAAGDRSRKREALNRFREALARAPKMSDARYRLALVLHSLGEGNAGSELERLVIEDPKYTPGYLLL